MVKITQNSALFPETTETKFADVLMYFSESLLGIDNEEAILWDLAKNCISKLGFVDCVVYLINDAKDTMIQKAAYGPKNPKNFEIYQPVDRPLGYGIVGHVAKTGNAELIHDASKDNRYKTDDEFRYSEVCVPIIIDGEVIGIIDCEHPEKHFFSEHHLHMLLTISSICAIKIKGVRLHNKYIKQQEQTQKIKKQLADLKLKALSTQLNPHFVFNALNAIQYFITSENKEQALKYLSTFSKLIRYNLKYIEEEKVNLKDEIDMLNWYLRLQKLRYTDTLAYNLTFAENLKFLNTKIPAFIIQTLFENLTENAIYNQHQNNNIQIHFEAKSSHVSLTINYSYITQNFAKKQKPEYREQLAEWQDQINLLNKIKKYNIEKEIAYSKTNTNHNITRIILKLPILS